MSGAKGIGTGFSLIAVPCPICGMEQPKPLLPSAKRDEVGKTFYVHEDIKISVCENCGTVFENPQIKLAGSTPYAEKNYYTIANSAWHHDDVQHSWTFYNWHALKDALPWDEFRHVLDVGAAGAWSNAMLERAPNIEESVLVEPSPRGIFNCEVRYPKVRAELGIFEEYSDTPGHFDLITFNNSFYSVSEPIDAFRKVNSLLRPGGYLVVCFSYVGMELEFWDHGNPFVHMSHAIRGVPLIYYSLNTYKKLLELTGFELVDDIVFELPEWDQFNQAGRQIDFVIAKGVGQPKEQVDPLTLNDPTEVAAAKLFYTTYCAQVTAKSVALYAARTNADREFVLHDGDEWYGLWALQQLHEAGIRAQLIDGKSFLEEQASGALEDIDGTTLLLAGDWDESENEITSLFSHAQVVNCSPPEGYKGYGNRLENLDGSSIVTRSFCPSRLIEDQIFPFAKRPSMNPSDVSREELGVLERPNFLLPRTVDDVPFFAGEAAKFALSLSPDDRRTYLQAFYNVAIKGPMPGSIISLSDAELPAMPVILDFEKFISAERLSGIRPLIQWAALFGPTEFLQKAVEQLNEIYAGF